MSVIEPRDYLVGRLAEVGVVVPPLVFERVNSYFRLLAAWNKKINLTGFDLDSPSAAAIDRLLVEPLAVSKLVVGHVAKLVDIGSGGGSPGIPLALALGTSRLTLVEARFRKAIFLKEALRVAGLEDSKVLTSRHEELARDADLECDALTARAVRLDKRSLSRLAGLLRLGGHAYLFRTDDLSALVRDLPPSLRHVGSNPLPVGAHGPGGHLVILQKV